MNANSDIIYSNKARGQFHASVRFKTDIRVTDVNLVISGEWLCNPTKFSVVGFCSLFSPWPCTQLLFTLHWGWAQKQKIVEGRGPSYLCLLLTCISSVLTALALLPFVCFSWIVCDWYAHSPRASSFGLNCNSPHSTENLLQKIHLPITNYNENDNNMRNTKDHYVTVPGVSVWTVTLLTQQRIYFRRFLFR